MTTLAELCPHCQQSTTNPDSVRRVHRTIGAICTWRCSVCLKTWARFVTEITAQERTA